MTSKEGERERKEKRKRPGKRKNQCRWRGKRNKESRYENEEVRIINRKKIKVVSIILDRVKTIHEQH